MLISTYSKSPHFDPKQLDAHLPTSRDEVGLVRAIVVKVRFITLLEKKHYRSFLIRNAHCYEWTNSYRAALIPKVRCRLELQVKSLLL